MDLKNKVVVITGASKGLGKALASKFLDEEAKVIVNARSKEELEKVKKEINVFTFVGDVTKEKDMQKLADFAVKKFKKIDIWINNAGVGTGHIPIEKTDSREAHRMMEVNFFGTFYGSRSAMKYMKKQKNGAIINIISIRSLVPHPLSAVYSSSKWATRGFTSALRMVLNPYRVFVMAIYPSRMKTEFFGKIKPTGYENYMEPSYVARKIIQNLKSKKPKEEIIIKK